MHFACDQHRRIDDPEPFVVVAGERHAACEAFVRSLVPLMLVAVATCSVQKPHRGFACEPHSQAAVPIKPRPFRPILGLIGHAGQPEGVQNVRVEDDPER